MINLCPSYPPHPYREEVKDFTSPMCHNIEYFFAFISGHRKYRQEWSLVNNDIGVRGPFPRLSAPVEKSESGFHAILQIPNICSNTTRVDSSNVCRMQESSFTSSGLV